MLKVKFGEDFDAEVWSRLVEGCISVKRKKNFLTEETLKLEFGRVFEVGVWSKF